MDPLSCVVAGCTVGEDGSCIGLDSIACVEVSEATGDYGVLIDLDADTSVVEGLNVLYAAVDRFVARVHEEVDSVTRAVGDESVLDGDVPPGSARNADSVAGASGEAESSEVEGDVSDSDCDRVR